MWQISHSKDGFPDCEDPEMEEDGRELRRDDDFEELMMVMHKEDLVEI